MAPVVEGWSEFTVIAGGASAALVGLLFVAVSIRAATSAKSKGLRSRVAQVLTIFLGLLGSCILVSLPNPADWVLGTELIVAALMMGAAFIVLNHRADRGAPRESLEKVLTGREFDVATVPGAQAFLALALRDCGRHDEALHVSLLALARTLPLYQRAVVEYAQSLKGANEKTGDAVEFRSGSTSGGKR